ncbi:MAG: hypothetical protein QXE31_04455 [Candidatus Woesearchaeota archaeon]
MNMPFKIFKSKKASHDAFSMLWEKIINLFIAFFVIFVPLMAFVLMITSSDYFERNYIATDLSLINEAILSSNNDIVFFYDKELQDYNLIFNENKLQIKKDQAKLDSFFLGNPSIKISETELNPIIEKTTKNEKVIPIQLAIIKTNKKINYYNLREKALENK